MVCKSAEDPGGQLETDHLNTPRLVADATGTTVWRWDQAEPFGSNPADEDPDANSVAFDLPLRLPGQRYDKETGLHYNYFRDYDPGLGRYGESDPIGLRGGINAYVYANSPLAQIDVYGLMGKAPGGPQQRFPGSSCGPEHDPNNNFPGSFGAWSFEKACGKHDACYRICRKPKALCDDEFHDDMRNECDSIPPATWFGFAKNICRLAANDYHDAAYLFGGPSYNRGQANCKDCK